MPPPDAPQLIKQLYEAHLLVRGHESQLEDARKERRRLLAALAPYIPADEERRVQLDSSTIGVLRRSGTACTLETFNLDRPEGWRVAPNILADDDCGTATYRVPLYDDHNELAGVREGVS